VLATVSKARPSLCRMLEMPVTAAVST
jgi:hypothetical protein